MKKILIILLCVVVAGGSAGAILYLQFRPQTVYYTLKDNITSDITGSNKHAVLSAFLKLNRKGHDKDLEENIMVVRNAILFTIRGKTEDDLRNVNVIESLSGEILSRLSEHMDTGYIDAVLFGDFYIG